LPVGGNTRSGILLKEFVLYEAGLEDEIPKLSITLPKLEIEKIESGDYYLNLHIVTGRKPQNPRAGDLLLDGSRQEMTQSTYDAMARFSTLKGNQWTRYQRMDLETQMSTLIDNLGNSSHPGFPTPLLDGPSSPLLSKLMGST